MIQSCQNELEIQRNVSHILWNPQRFKALSSISIAFLMLSECIILQYFHVSYKITIFLKQTFILANENYSSRITVHTKIATELHCYNIKHIIAILLQEKKVTRPSREWTRSVPSYRRKFIKT